MKPQEAAMVEALQALARIPSALDAIDAALVELGRQVDALRMEAGKANAALDAGLIEFLPRSCPVEGCSGTLNVRHNHGNGSLFLGCSRYPKCKGSADYFEWRRDAVRAFMRSVDPG